MLLFLIASGLFLFTYHYTEFHALGFSLIMVASFLSGLRWTITQLITQKHELGKVQVSLDGGFSLPFFYLMNKSFGNKT